MNALLFRGSGGRLVCVGAGEEVQVADDAADTTAAVLRLMDNPQLARELGRRAAVFVRQHYRWQEMFTILDRELDRLMN